MFQNRYTIASFTLESGSHIRSERNWLTVGMHKNVAVPMRLAKRHDLTKSQIRLEINQNHATRHDLVHSLYKGFLAAFQESIYVVNRKQRCEAPFLMLFSSCFLFSRMCLFLGFCVRMASVRWKQMHNTYVSFHKENLVLGKISIGGSWQLFKCIYSLSAYWRWQYAMLANDTGMLSYRGSL